MFASLPVHKMQGENRPDWSRMRVRESKTDRGSELPRVREQAADNRQAKLFADVEKRVGSGAHKKDEEPQKRP